MTSGAVSWGPLRTLDKIIPDFARPQPVIELGDGLNAVIRSLIMPFPMVDLYKPS
jgi:hypothetical protein